MNATNVVILALSITLFGHGKQKANAAQNPPAAPATDSAASTSAMASDTYVIGPADVLTITVWKEPTLSGNILVRPDGMVSLALLGDVRASGLTPPQLADQISKIQTSPWWSLKSTARWSTCWARWSSGGRLI